ncbi:MAG TPA: 30S ribosomal protein S7 [Acidobacteriota bacterium]|nr:30S ribosomal protein S7 [Acidobacteriota bacterium]
MPRRREVPKRAVLPDPVYGNELVSRMVNKLMQKGKKSTAEGIFYDAMSLIEQRTGEDPLKVFKQAVENVKPFMETKSRRVGGSTYQIPIEVNPRRRTSLGLRWLVMSSKFRNERTMAEKLANEIMDAANHRGGAVRKKEDVHRMADANKAFAHYRW